MAEYRLSVQTISRVTGRSAVAAAAYRAGEALDDERTQLHHDYRVKAGVVRTEIIAPEHAPEWATDRQQLWNNVESAETRINSRTTREVLLSLPHELTQEQRIDLVRDFVKTEFVDKGMVADIAIHLPSKEGDERNHHAHVMLTTREIGPENFTTKNRDWNKTESLDHWRESWATTQNIHLKQALGNQAPQVSHKSYADQGIDKLPGPHLGPAASAMTRKNEPSFLADDQREFKAIQKELREIVRAHDKLNDAFAVKAETPIVELKTTLSQTKFAAETNRAKLQAELKDTLKDMKTKNQVTAKHIWDATMEPHIAAEKKAKSELDRAMEKEQPAKPTTVMRWITNPADMLWREAKKQIAQDNKIARLQGALAETKITKDDAKKWLKTEPGKEFMKQQLAEIKAKTPETFQAAQQLNKATNTKNRVKEKLKAPKGQLLRENKLNELQGNLTELRTHERKLRRNIPVETRNIAVATKLSSSISTLQSAGVANKIIAPTAALTPLLFLRAVNTEIANVVKKLTPIQTQSIQHALTRSRDRGIER